MFSAGKNLTTSRPKLSAMAMSLGQATPGVTGILFSTHQPTTLGSMPGEMM